VWDTLDRGPVAGPICAIVLLAIMVPMAVALQNLEYDATFGVMIQPSSITLKVGEKANITVTIINPERVSGAQVCFSVEGFPNSGFRTSITPLCSDARHGVISTTLTVEVTPASAPQTVTAYVIASSGNQTAQAVLNVSVEPAMPAWVPWLGLLLFFVLLGVGIAWRPRLPKRKASGSGRKQTKR
jgi:hypothetical protein